MPKVRFADEQNAFALRQAEAGTRAGEISRNSRARGRGDGGYFLSLDEGPCGNGFPASGGRKRELRKRPKELAESRVRNV